MTIKDVRIIAKWLRQKREKAVRQGTGVILTWEDAYGLQLMLEECVSMLKRKR